MTLLLYLVLLCGLAPRELPAQHFPADEELQVMLRYLVEDGATPGIVVAILEADGSTRFLWHGSAGPEAEPLGPRSVFEIGSITKTFTGALLADMVARGEVGLEDPVAHYLPDSVHVPSRDGREITLLDLATHHSGLPRLPDDYIPPDPSNPYGHFTVEMLYDFLGRHELRRAPGTAGEYSNLGYGLLGHALARAAGTTYEALLRERILDPLEMKVSGIALEGEREVLAVRGHDPEGEIVPHWTATEAMTAAGMLRSSAEEMLRYLQANIGPIDGDLHRAMQSAHEVRRPLDDRWGIGLAWQVLQADERTVVTHTGGTGGFSARISFDPERRIGIVLLTNRRDFPDDFDLDLLRGNRARTPDNAAVPREILQQYVGSYQLTPGGPAIVRLEQDGSMTLRVGNNVRFRMDAESDSTFTLTRAPWRVSFARDPVEGMMRMVLELPGATAAGPKVSDAAPTPREAAAAIRDLPLTPAEIQRYAGTYLLQSARGALELRVFGRNDRLMAQAPGQAASRLRFQGDDRFVPDFDDHARLIFTIEGDRASKVTLEQNGAVLEGLRAADGGEPRSP